jgi:hypothetical protein
MKPFSSESGLVRAHSGEAVYRHIRRAIENGELVAGQTLASTRALKARLGVSFHAVLSGLERLEREGWVSRRRGSGTYIRDTTLNGLHKAVARRVGVVQCGNGSPATRFLEPAVAAVREELAARSGQVVDLRPGEAADMVAWADAYDAAIWIGGDIPPESIMAETRPFVILSHSCERAFPSEGGYDIVTSDSRQGGMLAGRRLRESGCARAVFIGVRPASTPACWEIFSRLRLDGFEQGWGRELGPEDLLSVGNYQVTDGLRIAAEVVKRGPRPLGIFAASDDLAMGICHGAAAHGIELGKDVKLIGFDGQPARFAGDPELTTVAAPLEAMGRMAARFALERIERPDAPMRRACLGCALRKGHTA